MKTSPGMDELEKRLRLARAAHARVRPGPGPTIDSAALRRFERNRIVQQIIHLKRLRDLHETPEEKEMRGFTPEEVVRMKKGY